MRQYFTLLRRELGRFFVSFTGYVIIALALAQIGLILVILLEKLRDVSMPMPLVELFFATQFFWTIQLLLAPVITMRLFALEKSSGTFETLMTTAVTDLQVVLAKFSAALVFYLVLWLPFIGCVLLLRRYTSDPSALDFGALASTYLGLALQGCLFLSFGCLASALTQSQIVAAMMSFVFGVTVFVLSFLFEQIAAAAAGWLNEVSQHLTLTDHMQEFARGIVDTRRVVFYLSMTLLFLFLTHRVVESRRWK
jgi:ABC-2 type transport system permease protein